MSAFIQSSSALTNNGSINAFGTPLTENFNTLASTGTPAWADNSTIPGWYAQFGTSATNPTAYTSGTGSSNAGALYSFGSTSAADRALGSVGSGGTGTVYWAVKLSNNTGGTITSVDVSYVGEQWRNGGATSPAVSVAQTVDFQYQIVNSGAASDANIPTTGWIDYDPLDFTSPTFGTTAAAALDGNLAANRVTKASSITLTATNSQEIWLRWRDIDHSGNDHGMAIDDFSITANGTPGDNAPSVTGTTPTDGAINLAPNSNITINFSESVTTAAGAFAIECPTGSPQTFSQSASPATSFTLDPTSDLPTNTTCTVTVTASKITDQDVNDPPDQMAANFIFSFSTSAPTPTPTPTPTPAVPGSVVISQVYGGGGNSGATLKNDFIELINHSDTPIDLSGWSVQVASATASVWSVTPLTNFILQPGQYYLVQEAAGAGGTVNLPTPDATGTITMSATGAKVALVSNSTTLTGACPVSGAIIDFVGYDGANCSEGSPTPALTNTTAALRKLDGCLDTNNNASDFNIGSPNPRNSASPTNNCNVLFAIGSASPDSLLPGDSTTLTVQVFPPSSPPSTGITVVADLTSIGGSANQAFSPSGNTFTFLATVALGTSAGFKVLPVTVMDAQSRTAHTTITLNVQAEHIVISQIYGAGGNNGAVLNNDYVELYNPTNTTFTITGWTIQYASATGTNWTNRQPLGGQIGPGKYYLVKLASGGDDGAPLPPSQISGDINMAAGAGKVALVSNSAFLTGGCPVGSDPDIVDFVGYGTTANCREGAANAPIPSATLAIFRSNGGEIDTDQNSSDFVTGSPNPRQTEPIVELGPWLAGTDPFSGGSNVPYDATVTIDFSEPVDLTGAWYNISCSVSGLHNDATVAMYNDFKGYHITPNTSFQFGEQCTVTVFKNNVSDKDSDDSGADTDHLFADEVFSFTVVGPGDPAPYPPNVHLALGNPSNAMASLFAPNNFLMEKPSFSLSYNRDKGTPNWVSWHLETDWFGSLVREDTFRADPRVSPDWYRVQSTDYFSSGFDRGHMTPNADRDHQNRIPINQETYLMTNMVPQAPDNNQGPWANMENDLRGLLTSTGGPYELYIVSGPLGMGGSGSNGPANTIADGHVTVPAFTWKVVLMLPKDTNDLSRINPGTRTIAVMMPNIQGIRTNDWHMYLTTVDAVEQETGYDFFSNVSDSIEKCIEAGINGDNPPCTDNQSTTTSEDTSAGITLSALSPDLNATFTYSIVSGPTHGMLTGTGANRSYAPNADFNGTDSFTFKVNDGHHDSNISTVTINITEVNDVPTTTADSQNTDEDTALDITAANLATNDSAGPANEATQILTVTSVTPTGDTHGTVTLSSGTIHYSPDSNYNGPASFEYQVCDNGTTNGLPDSKCATGTVNITVNPVNDAPTLAAIGNFTVGLGNTLNFAAVGSDIDVPAQALTYSLIGAPAGATINSSSGAFSWTPAAAQAGHIYPFTVRVTDDGSPNKFDEEQIQVAVAYSWSGLLAPVTAGGTYKAGRTIPIKFELTGPSAVVTDAQIHLLMFKVSNNVVGDEVDVQSTSGADTGNLFRYTGGQYIFNLNTSGLTAGTYQLQIDMGDGVMRAVNISLR
jgi:endonuclease G